MGIFHVLSFLFSRCFQSSISRECSFTAEVKPWGESEQVFKGFCWEQSVFFFFFYFIPPHFQFSLA